MALQVRANPSPAGWFSRILASLHVDTYPSRALSRRAESGVWDEKEGVDRDPALGDMRELRTLCVYVHSQIIYTRCDRSG